MAKKSLNELREENWRRSGSVLLCLLAVVLLSPLFAGAQELTATLSGVITDASGAVIPDATVSIALNASTRARAW